MRLIIKYLLNNLKIKKFRTALIVVFLTLCNFLIIANLGINDYYTKAYNANVEYEKGDVDLVVTPATNEDEETAGLLWDEGEVKLPKEKIADSFETLVALGKTETESKKIKVTIVGADLNSLINNKLLHDVEVKDSNQDYIVISESAKKVLDIAEGDDLTIDLFNEEHVLTVTDIAEKSGVFANDNDNSITVVMKLKEVQDYYHLEKKVSSVYVNVSDKYSVDSVIQKIKDMNNTDDETKVNVVKSFNEEAFSQKKSANSLALMVAMLIMIFISVYLISFISKVIFLERMKVMGTFQSIGATAFQTSLIFIGENVCYGILGWIAGIGLSIAMCPKIFEILNSFQTNTEIDSSISPVYYLIALICSVAIMLFCSIGSVVKMKKNTVKELLIANTREENGIRLVNSVIAILLGGVAGILYFRNSNYNLILGVACFVLTVISSIILCKLVVWIVTKAFDVSLGRIFRRSFKFGVDNLRNDKMLRSSVTLITIVVSMLLCIIMVILSIKSSMETMIDNNDFDISCTSLSSDLNTYKEIPDLNGVSDTYFDYIYNTKVDIDGVKVGATLVGVDDEDEFYLFRSQSISYDRDNAQKLLEGRYIMIDSFLADKNNVAIGDKISLTDSDDNEIIGEEFEIIDVIDSSGFTTARDTILLDTKYLTDEFNADPYQYLIKIDKDADVDEVASVVADELIETSTVVMTITEVVNNSLSGVDALIMILYLIIGICALLVIFGVINNITVSFLSRKRELAVLYSTAMSKGQLNVMFYGEILTMYMVIILYSIGLTVVYKYIMPKILWSAGLAFQMRFPMEGITITAIVLFVILNVLVFIPVINLYCMNTVNELKYD